jgi:hypothetical protein
LAFIGVFSIIHICLCIFMKLHSKKQ